MNDGVFEKNALGGYQRSIPLPLFVGVFRERFRCPCQGFGRKSPTFRRMIDYENHYFREHLSYSRTNSSLEGENG